MSGYIPAASGVDAIRSTAAAVCALEASAGMMTLPIQVSRCLFACVSTGLREAGVYAYKQTVLVYVCVQAAL
jgi:hypothetical protein